MYSPFFFSLEKTARKRKWSKDRDGIMETKTMAAIFLVHWSYVESVTKKSEIGH
jgi:hypothetical protein